MKVVLILVFKSAEKPFREIEFCYASFVCKLTFITFRASVIQFGGLPPFYLPLSSPGDEIMAKSKRNKTMPNFENGPCLQTANWP